jgi:predicted RND superfamily exporter protein
VAFDELQATYTKNDNILFVVKPRNADVFAPHVAQAVEELTAEAWKIPFAIRVDSITNFQHSWADGDELTVEDLIRDGASLTEAQLRDKREVALAEPLLAGFLIRPDAAATGVNVTLQYPEESFTEVPEAAGYARDLARRLETDYPQLDVAVTGVSMLNNAFAEAGQKDMMLLIPIMFGVLILVTALTLRCIPGTLATVLVIIFSTATAMGLAGWLGIRLAPISAMAPTVILTLAIADSIHILVSQLTLMRQGLSKLDALREALRINFLAVSITSLTTIVGFAALNFSDAPPFRDLGNITAMGIAAAWFYSIIFLPALIRLVPVRVRLAPASASAAHGTGASGRIFAGLARFVTTNYRTVLVTSLAAAFALAAIVPTLELDDQWIQYFDHRVEFRRDADFAQEHLTGLYLIEFSVEAPEAGGISEPHYLALLERFTTWLRSQPEVLHVYSYSDIIKRLNRNMHADDDAWYRLPDDRELAAQYLLLYELSLPYGLDLNDRIAVDKSATRVTATIQNLSTVEVRGFLDRSRAWLQAENMRGKPSGPTAMFSLISQRNIESMLRGNGVAVLLIATILVFTLRSVRLGVLSLIPNAVPLLMTFGVWALLVGQVGMAAATVSATSLGIIVDSTVHFLTKFLRARREQELDRPGAIAYAFQTVGLAIAINVVILAFGFSVLALSTFKVNAEMGLLTAIAVLIALAVDFLLLPAMLMIGHAKERRHEHEQQVAAQVA